MDQNAGGGAPATRFLQIIGERLMAEEPFEFIEEIDEEAVIMPDGVMEAVEAAAHENGIGVCEMMKVIFVQWYEHQSRGDNPLH